MDILEIINEYNKQKNPKVLGHKIDVYGYNKSLDDLISCLQKLKEMGYTEYTTGIEHGYYDSVDAVNLEFFKK